MDYCYGPGRDLLVDGCIVLHGMVGGSFWDEGFTASDVVHSLAALGPTADVTVRINSSGGIAHEGLAIHAVLTAHKGKVTTVVEGLAASAASIIAQAGDERVMSAGAMMMVHDAAVWTEGNASEHQKSLAYLEVVCASLAAIYADATKQPVEEIRAEMAAETWLTAEDAVAKGYADRIGAASDNEPAPFPFRAYAKAPQRLVAMADARGWSKRPLPNTATASAVTRNSINQTDDEEIRNYFEIGDPVEIINPHDPSHSRGTIQIISGETPYGILIEGMEEMGIHRWYTTEEIEYSGSDAINDVAASDGKKKKKPMRQMKMQATSSKAPIPGSQPTPKSKEEAPMPGSGNSAAGASAVASNVVDLDAARAEGRTQALAYMREIQDLCALAGKPELATAFIEKEAKPSDVRAELLGARASADAAREVSTQTLPGDGAKVKASWGDAVAQANNRIGGRASGNR